MEKLQEIPAWAQEVWARESERLASVGLTPRRPGVRQVTLILLPEQRELKTTTSVAAVDALMAAALPDDLIEVESLDYDGQMVRIRAREVVGWFAAVYDDSIPEQRPVPQPGGLPPGFDLSQLPTRRGKG